METIKENVQAAGSLNGSMRVKAKPHKGSQKYSSSPKGEIGIRSSAEGLLYRRNPGLKH